MPWRRRRVTEEQGVPAPRRPLIWPWLLLLLLLVAGGIAAAYLLTRDGDTTAADRGKASTIFVSRGPGRTQVPAVVGFSAARALERLQAAGLKGRTFRVASRRPRDQVLEQSPAPGTEAKKGSVVVLTTSKGQRTGTVPSVVGITEASATSTLEGLGYKVAVTRVQSSQPRGFVVSQKPTAGTPAAKGTVVTINVSQTPTPTTTTTTTATTTPTRPPGKVVPNVVGLAQRIAVARLQRAGFRVDSYPARSRRPRGTVLAQGPSAGKRALPTSVVRIDVSLGSGRRPLRTVPDVVSMPEAQAKQVLVQAGFTVRSVDQAAADRSEKDVVLDQRPAAGASRPAASQVILVVGRFPPPVS